MSERPAVCVVVPVYRAEATLDRCVRSILAQAVDGGLCCVLVEDGSPDKSGAMCDEWAARDARVKALHLAPGQPMTFRLSVTEDSPNVGGLTLFGKSFGNYRQDIRFSFYHESAE